jgi:prepilin-type N-terminal cleavage/methylation domain-containing protein
MKRNGHACRQAGFTLIELLVAISIIAVLSAILLPNFMSARERARDAQKIQNLYAIKNALRLYYNDHQSYSSCLVGTASTCLNTDLVSYLPGIAGIGYTYATVDPYDSFELTVGLESGAGEDDKNSQVVCGFGPGTDKLFMVCAK